MARKSNEQPVTQQDNDTQVNVDQEKEQMKRQIDELSALVKQLLEEKTKQNTIAEGMIAEIDPNKKIRIISLISGGLNLKSDYMNQPFYLSDFGKFLDIKYDDLNSIVNNQRELAENGAFWITNKEAVEALYLEEDYKRMVEKDTIEKIMTLHTNDIVDIIGSVSDIQKETILQLIIKGIRESKEGYTDLNKIKAISDNVGQDLLELAKDN